MAAGPAGLFRAGFLTPGKWAVGTDGRVRAREGPLVLLSKHLSCPGSPRGRCNHFAAAVMQVLSLPPASVSRLANRIQDVGYEVAQFWMITWLTLVISA